MILEAVWTRKRKVTDQEVLMGFVAVFFNPVSLIGPAIQNMGCVKDLVMYLSIFTFLEESKNDTRASVLRGIALVIDPGSWPF
mmetsp:Transcript_40656/g.61990  ORF Transcript_40656/g.61990 Transcript_40656/m.61990 type:complete len:83 (+) Transcript_40656:447-695(+)